MSKAITYEQATYEMLVEWTRRAMLAEEKLAAAEARIAELEACWNASDVLIGTIEDENKELRARIVELEAALRWIGSPKRKVAVREYKETARQALGLPIVVDE